MAMMASRTWDASSTFTRFVTSFWLRRECIGSAAIIRVCLLREQGYLSPFPTGSDTELPENTAKSGSRPISRVLWQGTPRRGHPRQPFLWARSHPLALATYPQASVEPTAVDSSPPRLPIWCCSGWRLPRFTPDFYVGTRLCGPVRRVATPGGYPASRSMEPGLSSAPH